jgi:ribosomal protein S18 acetylase RimI-like enzyme
VLVLQAARKQGVGAALINALEAEAQSLGRTLLFLDTRTGDDASRLYERLGYIRVGELPGYVLNAEGQLEGTVFYYKHLTS